MAVKFGGSGRLLTAVRLELDGRNGGGNNNAKKKGLPIGGGATGKSSNGRNVSLPHLSLTKPSWLVRTESNVRKEVGKLPDPPCVVCKGSGRVDCYHCSGKGRTNYVHMAMLPKGEWPKWCRTCGGSGLEYCSRCLGTGEYRYIMGFRFMKRDLDDKDQQLHQHQVKPEPYSSADRLLNREQSNSTPDIG